MIGPETVLRRTRRDEARDGTGSRTARARPRTRRGTRVPRRRQREDEVGVLRGQEVELASACPGTAPCRAARPSRWRSSIAAPGSRTPEGSRPGSNTVKDAFLLVVLERHPDATGASSRPDERRRPAITFQRTPPSTQSCDEVDRHEDQRRTHVRLQRDQADGHPDQQAHLDQLRSPRLTRTRSREVDGKHQTGRPLGQFRGLQPGGTEDQPRAVAADLATEEQDGDEQQRSRSRAAMIATSAQT